jgi:imidazolonepropionase-like amidohydrolase
MNRLRALAAGAALQLATSAGAQDLVIVNARILDGAGTRIEQGSIVIDDGRIVSVAAGIASAPGARVLDAQGRTVLPGFIDAHRHIMRGADEAWFRDESAARMREFLEAGFTTLMSGGGPLPGIIQLERRVEAGELRGPRIITSGRADPTQFDTPDKARAQVRALAATGVQIVKASVTPAQKDLLAVIVDEAHKHDLEVMVHAVTVPAMLAAVEAGADKLVHTPHDSFMTNEHAQLVAAAGIEALSTVGFAVPVFGVFNDDNVPTFRDGSPWPAGILGTGSNAAGEKTVNARTLWDNGVVYGFGTDTGYLPREGLKHELRALNLMFSPQDILKLMGPNTAAFIDRSDELGVLAPGKIADIVIVAGDPLDLIFNLLNVEVVIKGGEVVVDRGRAADEAAGAAPSAIRDSLPAER